MSIRHTACSDNLGKNLEELKRRRDLESLRPFLIQEGCFPAHKDPEKCQISAEDLKKLGRIWKIQERKTLMRSNADITDIVNALLQHISNNKKFATFPSDSGAAPSSFSTPAPPDRQRNASPRSTQIKNYCGLKVSWCHGLC